jgi:hypothetical protein
LNDELEITWEEVGVAYVEPIIAIFPDRLMKTTNSLRIAGHRAEI